MFSVKLNEVIRRLDYFEKVVIGQKSGLKHRHFISFHFILSFKILKKNIVIKKVKCNLLLYSIVCKLFVGSVYVVLTS